MTVTSPQPANKVTINVPAPEYEVLERKGQFVESEYLRQTRAIQLGKTWIYGGGELGWISGDCGKYTLVIMHLADASST